MKLIEKLGHSAFEKAEGSSIPGKESDYTLHCGCKEDFTNGYNTGFRKAREMAEKLHHDGRHGTGMCDVCANDGEWLFEEMVRNMGEEEV